MTPTNIPLVVVVVVVIIIIIMVTIILIIIIIMVILVAAVPLYTLPLKFKSSRFDNFINEMSKLGFPPKI